MERNNIGQDKQVWTGAWDSHTPEQEIRMWDYYGLRHWITKFIPRHGKVLEAGCGLGRYNFYFDRMGIDIDGLDFSEDIINKLNQWKKQHNFNTNFIVGDVQDLPYNSNSLSGYISLGVIEHFIDGPRKVLAEAYRVLRPGGIAIITTPSKSWFIRYRNLKTQLKKIVKKILIRKIKPVPFFQYEYSPRKLKKFVKDSGLHVTDYDSGDLLYTFLEYGNFNQAYIDYGTFGYWFSDKFENTSLRCFGAQAITIAVKLSDQMYCFLSGKQTAHPDSLIKYTVPISKEYQDHPLSKYYLRRMKPRFASSYMINPTVKKQVKEICAFSASEYTSDELFEDYGFNKKVAPDTLGNPEINIKISNENIQPIWRSHKKIL